LVIDPKYPVAGTVSPTAVSHVWSVFTSAPFSPGLRVRLNTDPDEVVFTIEVGALGLSVGALELPIDTPPDSPTGAATAPDADTNSASTRRTTTRVSIAAHLPSALSLRDFRMRNLLSTGNERASVGEALQLAPGACGVS
jgi:hypothetical protein